MKMIVHKLKNELRLIKILVLLSLRMRFFSMTHVKQGKSSEYIFILTFASLKIKIESLN